jgi:hypothetical protein
VPSPGKEKSSAHYFPPVTNLQVGIGGQNVLNSTLNMTYENFLEQVNLAEQFKSSDFGVSTGLVKDIGNPANGIS